MFILLFIYVIRMVKGGYGHGRRADMHGRCVKKYEGEMIYFIF